MKIKTVSAMDETFSAVGFGCWAIGGEWNNTSDQTSLESIQRAVDLGVNFFDVASVYGFGHAEEVLGKALKGRRHKVLIASKCGLVWDAQKTITKNLTAKSILQEIDDSLRRLNTDHSEYRIFHVS